MLTFENDILDLVNVFIPPMMSSTMNSDVLKRFKIRRNKARTQDNEDQGKEVTEKQYKIKKAGINPDKK